MHWHHERRWACNFSEQAQSGRLTTFAPLLWWLLAGLSRRKWLAVTVWATLTAAAGACLWRMPAIYQAEAVVLVESQSLPAGLMPATVEARLEERVNGARQKLMSSSHLQTVVRQLGLYAPERKAGVADSVLTAQMRRFLVIQPVVSGSYGRSGPFSVTFKAPDPHTAARVANHLAKRFVEEISAAGRSSSLAAADFFSGQVRSAKSNLEMRETALRDFRFRHSGELPEQAESLRSTARRLREELAGIREQVLGVEREKRALGQSEAARRAESAASVQERPATSSVGTDGAPPRRGTQAEDLRKRMTSLLMVYKPEHPDVRRLAAELARAESSETEAASSRQVERAWSAPKPDPSSAGEKAVPVAAQVRALESRLEELAARRIQLAAELGSVEERLQRMPLRQQELATLMREYAFYSEQFRNLAAKQQSAEIAEAMERKYPPERVSVLDEAQPPERSLGPNRWLLWMAVSLGGLVVGCLVALARECGLPVWSGFEGEVPAMAREDDHDPIGEPDWSVPAQTTEQAGSLAARRG